MNAENGCRGCGNLLPRATLNGLCPVCLMREGLAGAGGDTGPFMSGGAQLAASALSALDKTLGGLPHVLLRDSDLPDGPGPLVQPGSPEMPAMGARSGRLQLLGELARGGMGAVLKGRDPDLGRDLAVKVLLESHRDKPELIRRFVEEAQIGGQLQHPGIVPIYELGAFADRRPYFAMKLVKGRTLASLLDDRADQGHDLSRFLSIFESVCQTIAYAHARGVIHRDLKPSNIMVGSFGEVQVMDWGLAKVLPQGGVADDVSAGKTRERETIIATARSGGESGSDLSRAGSVMGTPSYMAPEQARGEVDRLDERCDVFALGSILCEILTGEPAFTGRSSGEIQRKASHGELKGALDRLDRSGSDPELTALAKDCLALELEDRPRHAGDLAAALSAYQSGVRERLRLAEIAGAEEKARAAEATKLARVERDRSRLTVALAAAVLALGLLGGGGAFWVVQQRQVRLIGVESTVARIQAIRDQAAADGAGPAQWREVLAAADESLASLGNMAASEPGRRLESLRERIVDDREQAERDVKLAEELASLRTSLGRISWENNPSDMDRRFRRAFKRYGSDLEVTPIIETVARLKMRPEAFVREVVGSLDHWLIVRQALGNTAEKDREFVDLQRILDLAQGLDSDPERNRLRAFLKRADLKSQLQILGTLAQRSRFVEFGSSTALLLARLLQSAGDTKNAVAVLRAAVIRYPADPWTNFELATLLRAAEPPEMSESIRYYTAARALRPETGWDLAEVLDREGRDDEAVTFNRELSRRNPKSIPYLFNLFRSLRKNDNVPEARSVAERITAPLRARIGREPENAVAHYELGKLLWLTGDRPGAIAELREAVRVDPKSSPSHQLLAVMLLSQDDLPGAIAAYRAAIRVQPSDENSRYDLASVLERTGDRKGQIAELREAIRARSTVGTHTPAADAVNKPIPDESGTKKQGASEAGADEELRVAFDDETGQSEWLGAFLGGMFASEADLSSERGQLALGIALAESGDLPGAVAAYLEAIRLAEGDNQVGAAAPHVYLGNSRRLLGDVPGAIAAYRDALRLDPDLALEDRYSLITTLAESGDIQNATAEFREAIQREPLHRIEPFRLLRAIAMSQRPESAIVGLRRVRDQIGDDRTTARAIDVAIEQVEQISKQGVKLPTIIRRSFQPSNFVEECYDRRFFAASAAIWSAAFVTDSKLADDMETHNRYNAACSAALAAAGAGIDKPPLDEQAKSRWRNQALDWLKADLAHWAKQAESGAPEARARVNQTLTHWKADTDLASVRDENELAKRPESERKEWQAFWAEVDALLKKADGN